MKLKNLFILALSVIVFGTSCSKSTSSSSTSTPTVDANGNIVLPANISGALYAIHTIQTAPNFPVGITQSAIAWFNSATASDSAGTVSINNVPLYQFMTGTMYNTSASLLFYVDSNNLVWTVQGNSTKGIPAFTYTHTEPFPKSFTYSVNTTSGKVNLNNSLTITNSALPSNITAIVYGIKGDKGTKNVGVAGTTSTSYTFSSSDLNSVAKSGSQIGVTAMPIIMNPATLAGKTFYFVKQFQVNQIFDVQ